MWAQIRSLPGAKLVQAPAGYGEVLLLPVPADGTKTSSCWLIGRYRDQTRLATDLRTSETLQDFVADCSARFGLRETDRPPVAVERQERYGKNIPGASAGHDFAGQRLQTLAQPFRPGAAPVNRISDRKENVRLFWATQTPQSHPIVEFNHFRD